MGCEMGGMVRRLCEVVGGKRGLSKVGERERSRGEPCRTLREWKRRLGTRLRIVDELDDEEGEEVGTKRLPRRVKCSMWFRNRRLRLSRAAAASGLSSLQFLLLLPLLLPAPLPLPPPLAPAFAGLPLLLPLPPPFPPFPSPGCCCSCCKASRPSGVVGPLESWRCAEED